MPKKNAKDPRNDSYRIDRVDQADTENFDKWTPAQFVSFLQKAQLGDYSEIFLHHKISGRLAPLLTDGDLKEMGIGIVGDRLRLRAVIHALGRKVRYDTRTKIWWEGKEQLYFGELEKYCWTCCGLCPDGTFRLCVTRIKIMSLLSSYSQLYLIVNVDPSTYKLTSNHLRIKTVQPARCGPIRLCCCYRYSINNLDLSKINDVDILGEPAPCCQRTLCCVPGKDHVEIMTPTETPDGKVALILKQGDGEKVSGMILHQIEEAQMIERD